MPDDCLFCRIISKQIPAKVEFENDSMVAIHDINPQAPVHILFIPKKHVAEVSDITEADRALVGDLVFKAKERAHEQNLDKGFRLVFNNGKEAGQSVFHVHLHLLAGRTMKWPPGWFKEIKGGFDIETLSCGRIDTDGLFCVAVITYRGTAIIAMGGATVKAPIAQRP